MHRLFSIPIGVAIVASLLTSRVAFGQSLPVWFGHWTLNIRQSTFSTDPPPYRRGACTIERQGDGLTSICELVRVRGGVAHLEWTGRFDGRDYPVQGVDEAVTYAYTRIDDHRYDVVVKVDGVVAARSTVTVSRDGKTMTVVTVSRNVQGRDITTTTLYDRS